MSSLHNYILIKLNLYFKRYVHFFFQNTWMRKGTFLCFLVVVLSCNFYNFQPFRVRLSFNIWFAQVDIEIVEIRTKLVFFFKLFAFIVAFGDELDLELYVELPNIICTAKTIDFVFNEKDLVVLLYQSLVKFLESADFPVL